MSFTILQNCTGVNNVVDPERLPHDYKSQSSDIQYGVDVVISESMRLGRADGFSKIVSLTNGHSLYRKTGDCLVCQGTALYQVGPDNSLHGVRSGMSGDWIDYDQHGASIYYTNGSQIGIYDGGKSYVWTVDTYGGPTSLRQFAGSVPILDHLTFHAGHMIGSIDNTLVCSEFGEFGLWNLKKAIPFSSKIVMIESVKGGIFVSDLNETWFMAGTCIDDFVQGDKPVLHYPALEWSAIKEPVKGNKIGVETYGFCSIWNSTEGLCVGLPTGEVINLISDKILYPKTGTYGATLLRGYNAIATVNADFCTDTQLRVGVVGSKATTRRSRFGFNSYCKRAGDYLACKSDGLYTIGGNTHDGTAITGVFETMNSDLGYDGPKRVRFLYANMEGSGTVSITPYADEVAGTAKTATLGKTGQQLVRQQIDRTSQGGSWKFRISSSGDFSIDKLHVLTINRPKGTNNY